MKDKTEMRASVALVNQGWHQKYLNQKHNSQSPDLEYRGITKKHMNF